MELLSAGYTSCCVENVDFDHTLGQKSEVSVNKCVIVAKVHRYTEIFAFGIYVAVVCSTRLYL